MREKKEKHQGIDCSVSDCRYCNCEHDKCSLNAILVKNCDGEGFKETTMCASYKKR